MTGVEIRLATPEEFENGTESFWIIMRRCEDENPTACF